MTQSHNTQSNTGLDQTKRIFTDKFLTPSLLSPAGPKRLAPLLHANPGLRSAEQCKTDEATDFEFFTALNRRHPELIDGAVVRVNNVAVFPDVLAFGFFGTTNNLQTQHGLVLAVIG